MNNSSPPTQRYGYNEADFTKFNKYANVMLWGFVVMYLFFYNGRQNINMVISSMMTDFGVDKAGMGIVPRPFSGVMASVIFFREDLAK